MNILVTGNNGFIGKNLISRLNYIDNVNIVTFDRSDSLEKIEKNIKNIDMIFHLAGSNRPSNNAEFYSVNTDLTKSIIDILINNNLTIPLIFTSTIHAERNDDYGKSKKQAEETILEYAKNAPAYIFRLPNVFGKWCKPNYNSAVATFCYNIANGKDIIVNSDNPELNLVYIDDIITQFVKLIQGETLSNKVNKFFTIEPIYKINLHDLVNMIKSFKTISSSLYVPETGNEFTKKLYSTYLSYVPLENMKFIPEKFSDDRGFFSELIKTESSGQFSISKSKPGVIRGNHFHHTKIEKFIVISGKAEIKIKTILEKEIIKTFKVIDENLDIITIPPGYTHSIKNIGDNEMILLIWSNEIFDKKNPDTYYKEVQQ